MAFERELITNGTFVAWDSVGIRVEDPTDWLVVSEVGTDPEVSEVGTGEGHGGTGTGLCNIYSSGDYVGLIQNVTTVIGREYRVSIVVDTVTDPSVYFEGGKSADPNRDFLLVLSEVKTYTITFIAVATTVRLSLRQHGATDVTIDDVSIKICTFLGGTNRPLDYQFRRGKFAFR